MIDPQTMRDDMKKIVKHMEAVQTQRGIVVLSKWNKPMSTYREFGFVIKAHDFKQKGVQCIPNFQREEGQYVIIGIRAYIDGFPKYNVRVRFYD